MKGIEMSVKSLVLCMYVLVLTITASLRAQDWPNFRGPNHDGISIEKLAPGSVKPLWDKKIGSGCSSIAISGGKLYTMGNIGTKGDIPSQKDVVYCFNAETGKEIWRHEYPCGLNFKSNTPTGPFATPAVDSGKVYTFSRKGDVFCLDAITGKEIWFRNVKTQLGMHQPFQGGFAGSPLVLDNMVILNAGISGTALDKETGKVIWKSDPNVAAQSSPVPFMQGSKQCIAIFSGFGLFGVEAANGKELWRFPWPTKYLTNVSDPIVSGDKVFLSTSYNMGSILLDCSSGQPRETWRNPKMQNHYSTCVLYKGYLYGFDIAKLKCMDFKTGQFKWTLTGAFGRGSLMMADGKLIVLTEKGMLLIGEASPEAFKPDLKTQIIKGKCYAGPVYSNGKIYTRNDKSDLVCVAIDDKK
jgi:outer membrane protein assembly factor BamB